MTTADATAVSPPSSIEEALVRLHAATVAEAIKKGEVFKESQLTIHSPMEYHWKFEAAKALADKEKWSRGERMRWTSADTYGSFLFQYNIPR